MSLRDLVHRVTVQTRTEVPDGHDGFTESWSAVQSRLAAHVYPLSGRDLERARQIDPRATHEVMLRLWRTYDADLDGGRARIVWHDVGTIGDRTLEIIEPPREIEYRSLLAMTCKELR